MCIRDRVYVVEEYSPLFDRQHFLAFVRLDVPYMLTVGVALLVAAILKRSGFYRYFAAMFRSRARGILTLAVCLVLTLDVYKRQVQRGTHAELMTQGGLYRRFIEIREQAEGWRLA